MLKGYFSVTRQANILSFDDLKAQEASSARSVRPSVRSSHSRASLSSHASHETQAPSRSGAQRTSRVSAQGHRQSRNVAARIQETQHAAHASLRGYDAPAARQVSSTTRPRGKASDRYASALVESHPLNNRQAPQAQKRIKPSQGSPARSAARQSTAQERNKAGSARVSPAREKAQRAQNKSFAQELRKRFRSAKADRAFEKTVAVHDKASDSQGETSRAAMYEMHMGATQRKSSRMQEKDQRSSSSPRFLSRFNSLSPAATRVLAVLVVAVFAVALLYPSCASYYQEVRQLQQLQAEYEAIESYNAQMQASIDYLNTDEGVEDYARSELGWIRSDEKSATVEGVEVTKTDNSQDILYAVSEESISAPDTWYSGILDVLFGYRG